MAEANAQVPTFKLVLVGDGGTGKVCLPFPIASWSYRTVAKPFLSTREGSCLAPSPPARYANSTNYGNLLPEQTTFVKRHLTGEFEKKYMATLGVEVHPLGFTTVREKEREITKKKSCLIF